MKNRIVYFLLLFIFSGSHIVCMAAHRKSRSLPALSSERSFEDNPTAYVMLADTAEAVLSVQYKTFESSEFHSIFEGVSGRTVAVEADGYRVVKRKNIFSGSAGYENGLNRDVKWTNVRDVELLYPYLVADSLGGNYRYETYRLSGSWSVNHKRSYFGLRIKYRGEVAYRTADPRPENTISDLNLNPGYLYSGSRWTLGSFLDFNYYKQHVGISVEEPNRKDQFFILRGMGLYDHRFTTIESSFSRYYRAKEYQVGAHARYHKIIDFSTKGSYSYRHTEVEEADNRVPYNVGAHRIKWDATLQIPVRKSLLILTGRASVYWHTGSEQTYEQVVNDAQTGVMVWRKLSVSDKQKQYSRMVCLDMLNQQQINSGFTLWYGLDAQWQDAAEQFLLPDYHQQVMNLSYGVRAGGQVKLWRHLLDVDLRGGYRRNINSSFDMGDRQQVVTQMVIPEYEWQAKDFAFARLALAFHVSTPKRTFLTFFTDGVYAAPAGDAYRWQVNAGASFSF